MMKKLPFLLLIAAVVVVVIIVPFVIIHSEPDYATEAEKILSKYEKDDQYVMVYDYVYLKFNDRELNLYDLEKWYQFDKMHCFIDDSWIYFSGTDDNRDYCNVKLFKCDHYGENFSVVFEKNYPKNSVNDYGDAFMNLKVITHQDCCLQGYDFYIKHHSGEKEDKNSYALDVYNIENGEFKTILNGEEAYDFQVEVNMYKPQNGEASASIDQKLVDQTELAKELKESGLELSFKDTCYQNGETYAYCRIYTKSRYFKVVFKFDKQTDQLEFVTWCFGGNELTDILKIIAV